MNPRSIRFAICVGAMVATLIYAIGLGAMIGSGMARADESNTLNPTNFPYQINNFATQVGTGYDRDQKWVGRDRQRLGHVKDGCIPVYNNGSASMEITTCMAPILAK